jgi:archaellum component FlaF (FlaF/FlaG flagellin family)
MNWLKNHWTVVVALVVGIGVGYGVSRGKGTAVSDRIVTSDREVVTQTRAYVGVSKTEEKSRTEYKIVTRWEKGGTVVQTKEIEVVKEKMVQAEQKDEVKQKETEVKQTEHTVTLSKPNWSVAGSYGLDRSYTLEVDRRVLGPVFVGLRGGRSDGGFSGAGVVRVEW